MSHITPKDQITHPRVLFFGRLPAQGEVGGVTTFTFNNARNNFELIAKVIDFYPAAERKKMPPKTEALFFNGNRLIAYFKLFLIHLKSGYLFHHNFSSIRGLLLVSLFFKKRKSKWLLTLHNGAQQKLYEQSNFISRFIYRRTLRRYDSVAALSDNQACFYSRLLTESKKPVLFRSSPYVPLNHSSAKPAPINRASPSCFLISGFPTKIYRHLETLDVFEKLWIAGHNFSLILCLYGSDTDGIQKTIERRVDELPFATRKSHLNSEDFQTELIKANLYIRMNSVDSFGLVVAEALENNLQVIATNVCERQPGTFLIEKDNFGLLNTVLDKYLRNERIENYLSVQEATDSVISFREIYSRTLGEQK